MKTTRLYTILLVSFLFSATADSLSAQTITHVPLYTFQGDGASENFDRWVGGAGDVNGDGFADLIVGAPLDLNNNLSGTGSARVLSGSDGSVLYTFYGDNARDQFGVSVSGAGDVNGDGTPDLIVGVPGNGGGSARVLSGSDGSVLYNFDGDNPDSSVIDSFGRSVSGAGDVNGDGFADLIVGAPTDDNNGFFSGVARVFSGSDGSILYTFDGDRVFDNFGQSVSSAGDVNGDGVPDLIVGAPNNVTNGTFSGSACVLSGSDGSVVYTFNGDSAFDRFGGSVSGAGDVNGDGVPDLIVGAPNNIGSAIGSARVFSGSDGSVVYKFNGDNADDWFGGSVSGAGDVNGDGVPDLIVGAPNDSSNGISRGSTRVLSGSDGSVVYTFNGDSAFDRFGGSVSGAGDVNGDGIDDFIVGALYGGSDGGGYAHVFVSQTSSTLGDCNLDGVVNFLDIQPFITILSASDYLAQADIDQNSVVNFLDILPFIEILNSQ